MGKKWADSTWGVTRIFLGTIFLWPFFDKLIGLGFSTPAGKGWIDGVSPTYGFLMNAVHGPFAGFYQSLATSQIVAWLFMIGLLLIGLGLIFGVAMRLSCIGGALMLVSMWTALLPPEHNPVIDDHLIYAIVLLGLMFVKAGNYIGLGKWWSKNYLVKKFSWLE